MSQRALNQQLFHGTTAELTPGKDRIQPATKIGVRSIWEDTGEEHGQRSQDHAFATDREHEAWHFARTASSMSASYGPDDGERHTRAPRARVYTVNPNPRMKPGAFHHELGEYTAPSFGINGVHDIMPKQQGTFPQENWNKYRTSRHGEDANHPVSDDSLPGEDTAAVKQYQAERHNGALPAQHRDATDAYMNETRLHRPGQLMLDFEPPKAQGQEDRARYHQLQGLYRDRRVEGAVYDEKQALQESRQIRKYGAGAHAMADRLR